jgi:hypothetical protein
MGGVTVLALLGTLLAGWRGLERRRMEEKKALEVDNEE